MNKSSSHKSDVMRARVEPSLKAHAEAIFHSLGLTTSQAITLFLKQVEIQKGMPFPINIPNAETAKILKESEAGINVVKTKNIQDLFEQLGLDEDK
jgi:DNA-damage-inducible protein J